METSPANSKNEWERKRRERPTPQDVSIELSKKTKLFLALLDCSGPVSVPPTCSIDDVNAVARPNWPVASNLRRKLCPKKTDVSCPCMRWLLYVSGWWHWTYVSLTFDAVYDAAGGAQHSNTFGPTIVANHWWGFSTEELANINDCIVRFFNHYAFFCSLQT